ncbi:MAG TPA: hypothetical protein VJC17_03150 [Candidatus Dojkabacteria bacterium]|nr:hypothetical protein [Candidatus Dojkabacteria bacterium]
MKLLSVLLTPFAWLYVVLFKIRERLFGYKADFGYLPSKILPVSLPVHMDMFWLKRGFYGRNLCMVPRGHPFSERFKQESPFYQSWVGTYYLNSVRNNLNINTREFTLSLAKAAVADQDAWLKIYGVAGVKTRVVKSSVKFLEKDVVSGFNREIYYGEMVSGTDDFQSSADFQVIHLFSALTGKIYSRKNINLKLLYKDEKPSLSPLVKLFGYISVIRINNNKFILSYVCGAQENKSQINDKLFKTIRSIKIQKF